MAKVTAPLLSFDSRGQIAKTQVYASWKGRPYARRHVIPANPQTSDQLLTRNVFSWLQQAYKFAPSGLTDPWTAYAVGKVMTNRNAWSKFNLGNMRSETDLSLLTFSPGALGGIPAATTTITGGVGTVTVAATAPATIPSGWTLTGLEAAVYAQQDPHSGTDYAATAGEDLTDPYSIAFAGLAAGDYVAGGWLKWLRPDGRIAYSPSVTDTVTVT